MIKVCAGVTYANTTIRYYSSHNFNVSPTVITVTLNNSIKVFLWSLQKQIKNTHMDFFFPLESGG